jgi:hypothetical protein
MKRTAVLKERAATADECGRTVIGNDLVFAALSARQIKAQ